MKSAGSLFVLLLVFGFFIRFFFRFDFKSQVLGYQRFLILLIPVELSLFLGLFLLLFRQFSASFLRAVSGAS